MSWRGGAYGLRFFISWTRVHGRPPSSPETLSQRFSCSGDDPLLFENAILKSASVFVSPVLSNLVCTSAQVAPRTGLANFRSLAQQEVRWSWPSGPPSWISPRKCNAHWPAFCSTSVYLHCRDRGEERSVGTTEPTPGLPFIVAKGKSDGRLFDAVRTVIAALPDDARSAFGLRDVIPFKKADYEVIRTNLAQAEAVHSLPELEEMAATLLS